MHYLEVYWLVSKQIEIFLILLPLIFTLIPVWSENILFIISVFNICWDSLYIPVYCLFSYMFHVHMNWMYILQFLDGMLYMSA